MNLFSRYKYFTGLLLGLMIFQSSYADDDNYKLIVDLKGQWKFSIGNREAWIRNDYDDRSWDEIKVPKNWEEQGFHGYNGYAFYRKKVTISKDFRGHLYFLKLGYIDDVDEVYFNGELIGSTGSFPPKYESAYEASRKYYIPENLVTYDEPNIIAVKVYDNHSKGGIVSGQIGLYASRAPMPIDIHLSGFWSFNTGDDLTFKEPDYNDGDWNEILVPSNWENQGYRDYDGFAWYRKTFRNTNAMRDEKMVVLLGKIDDIDEVYLNGEFIGSTGNFNNTDRKSSGSDFYDALRGYIIPKNILRRGRNVISVRVYDFRGVGGIYEGPVGIITQEKYIKYWHKLSSEK
ncbi:MAG: hypothetical protein WD577_11195 [Bacteroidales bacterium]